MHYTEFLNMLFEALTYALPSFVVFLTAVYILNSFMRNEEQKRDYEMRIQNRNAALPIRLQAYERMVLFLERITPNNLIFRVKRKGMSASDLENALLTEIRNEFEHNLSQQLYLAPSTWQVVKNTKEEIIKLINLSYSKLPEQATALDLSKAIFDNMMRMEKSPTQRAILFIKKEAQEYL
jgi:hypothetical protein